MTAGAFRKYAEALEQTARSQGGYFTASQAVSAGFADSTHGHWVRKGEWIRGLRGLYRLAGVPEPAWPELVVFSLWTRDREGLPQGTCIGPTAKAIHAGRRDSGPVHLAVPRMFRKHAATPDGLQLHKIDLPPESMEEREGYRVVRREWMNDEGWLQPPAMSRPPIRTVVRDYNAIIEAGED